MSYSSPGVTRTTYCCTIPGSSCKTHLVFQTRHDLARRRSRSLLERCTDGDHDDGYTTNIGSLVRVRKGHSKFVVFTLCFWPHPILPCHGKCIVQLFLHVTDAYLASRRPRRCVGGQVLRVGDRASPASFRRLFPPTLHRCV